MVHPDGSWSSRCVRGDGTAAEQSGAHDDFAKAVAEALRSGFNPERDVWVVEHRLWATHYAPGARPVTIARAAPGTASGEHAAAPN